MLRDKLISNIDNLSEFEVYILFYVTHWDTYEFCDCENNSDEKVSDVLCNSFAHYFGRDEGEYTHPFVKVWRKVVDGINIDKLICHTDHYDKRYKALADEVNRLYGTENRSNIHAVLKLFVERDWDELCDKIRGCEFCDDEKSKIKFTQEHITMYANVVANNLDEQDLVTILSFCGVNIKNF